MVALAAVLGTLAPIVAMAPPASAAASGFVDINPDVSDNPSANATTGGRGNGVSAVPGEPDTYYVASEFGGVYKTVNGGDSWFHLDDHLPMATRDVQVDPGNTGTVYATSLFDGRTQSVSGIQVSYDGGATWAHPASATPGAADSCNAAAQAEPAAFGIAIAPDDFSDVFIGTNCGLAVTNNSGATWDFIDPTPATADGNIVWDVVAHGSGDISICGDDGFFYSDDNGANWTAGDLPAGRCTLAVSPDEAYVMFATTGLQAYESDNSNTTNTADGDGADFTSLGTIDSTTQSREAFVRTNPRSGNGGSDFNAWIGNVSLFRADCTTPNPPAVGGALRCPTQAAGWAGGFTRTNGAHDDVGDIVFDVNATVDACPTIFTSDGGVHQNTLTASPGCHTPTWQKANVGYHAEWLWTMTASDRPGATDERLAYGMQDDGIVVTGNAGATPPTWTQPGGIDVFDALIDGDRLLFTQCCFSPGRATQLQVANPDGSGVGQIGNYPSANEIVRFKFPEPIAQFGDDRYALLMANTGSAGDQSGGLYITNNIAAGPIVWTELGNAPDFACGVQVSVPTSTPSTPTFFLQVGFQGGGFNPGGCNSINGDQVWKYSGTAANGTWTRIDNNAGAGGFSLFAVDPSNPNRMYASRLGGATPQMVFSTDGGTTWQTDTELDALMTGVADFVYSPTTQNIQPTLLAYDPLDPNVIAAGGHDSGVFLSGNGGQDWTLLTDPRTPQVSGVPHLPQPRFAYFDHEPGSATQLFIGTRGRGAWRLTPSSADLRITKTASPSPAVAGEQLFYTITVTNDGPNTASDVTVTDNLPDEVTFVTSTGACTETPPGSGNLSCDLGDMASGETKSFVVKVLVDDDVAANAGGPTTITNNASVLSGGALDPDPTDNNATLVTIVEDEADLEVTKICKPDGELRAGETGTCTIYIDNWGPSTARDVLLRDSHLSDGEFTFGAIVASQGTCQPPTPADVIVCNLGDLPPASPGAEGRASVTVEVSATEAMDINDQARATSATPDPDTSNNSAEDGVTVIAVTDLAISKTGPATAIAGTDVSYTISIVNNGPSTAEGVTVTDNLSAGLRILNVSASNGAGCNTGVPGDSTQPTICSFGTLAPGAMRTVTISVRILPGTRGPVHNDTRVSSETFDDDTANNLATTTMAVDGQADLSMTKSDSPDPVIAGNPLTYTIVVTNGGPSTALDVVVTDTLDPNTTYVSGVDGNGATVCALIQTGIVSCDLGDLAPGKSVTIFLTVLVAPSTPPGTMLTNTATVASSTTDPNPANNTAGADTAVTREAEIWLDKQATRRSGNPAPAITYTIVVHNDAGCETDAQSSPTPNCGAGGPSDSGPITVTDTLPLDPRKMTVQFVSPQCTYTSGTHTVTCSSDNIPAGASVTFVIEVQVQGSVGTITNTATATAAAGVDPVASNNTNAATLVMKGGTGKK